MRAVHQEHTLRARDGAALSAQTWRPEGWRAEVLVVPGYADHAERYRELAHNLAEHGIATIAVDLRGHGRSSGRRGFVAAWDAYLDDVEAAWSLFQGDHRFLLGHSQGATVALDFVHRRRPELRGLVVTNPFLATSMPVPKLKLWLGRLMGVIYPKLSLPTEIPPSEISNDPTMVNGYIRDPLVFDVVSAGWFREVSAAQKRVRAIAELPVPLLYIYSAPDGIASSEANATLSAAIEAPDKTVWFREGEKHEVLNEVDRLSLHRQVGEWIVGHV
jgi:alpha-beta hydrolase superfamily lysophospholipase